MRIAKVIGKVTLNRAHRTFAGAVLKVVVPYTLDELTGAAEVESEDLVVWDALGAGPGAWIALSEGPEASQPFRPEDKAVDAYNAAILDQVNVKALSKFV